MKLLVLLLSDIHISTAQDNALKRAPSISSAVFHAAREAQVCLIAVVGDLTFAGSEDQFNCFKPFINSIRESLLKEGCPKVEIISVPGNHDCVLKPENRLRTRLIESITQNPEDAEDPSIVEACTSVQDNYFNFRQETTVLEPIYQDKLWGEYELDVTGQSVRVSALNASWMSSLNEKPGSLVFPIDRYSDLLKEPAHARLVLMHHPMNWYVQGSYHPLRVALRTHSTAIISGHEHVPASGMVRETDAGACLFFEAAALQPHELGAKPGFTSLVFDFSTREVTETRFSYERNNEVTISSPTVMSFGSETNHATKLQGLTELFEERLREPGADFKNAHKRDVSIDDFYVYPELQSLNSTDEQLSMIDSEGLIADDPKGLKIMLLGEQSAGKTTLLLQAFKDYRKQGFLPLYLRAQDLKGSSDTDIQKFIERAQISQYISPAAVKASPKERLIALLDDVERIKGGGRWTHRLISYLNNHYNCIILTATTGFEFSELVHREAWEATKEFESYEIAPFGSRLKHRLIKKWCLCGSVSTLQELEAKTHSIETTLNNILGKNLVPRVPIYILILLQSIEQNQQDILTNSHIGSYYGFMIDRSLSDAGVPPSKTIEIKGYLSELAWFIKSSSQKECSIEQLSQFNNQYTSIQNTVDLESRLELLTKARMLVRRDEFYSFTYPYIYYYFVGRHVAKRLSSDLHLKEEVSKWCAALHRQDNAHCVLFIAHHVNDEWVMNRVAEELDKCFDDQAVIALASDISAINSLIEKTSQLILEAPDVDKNQENIRKLSDEIERNSDTETDTDETKEAYPELNKFNQTIVTAGILGQILKGYYGEIRRDVRQDLVNRIISASFRLMYNFMSTLMNDPENLVSEIDKQLGDKMERLSTEDRRKAIKQMLYQFLGMLCTAIIQRTAQSVSADDLKEDIAAVISQNGSNAFRLVKSACQLSRPGGLPFDELKKLAQDLKPNPFAYGVLQAQSALYIQFFHMRQADRLKLCAATGIELIPPRPSDMVNEGIGRVSHQRDKPSQTQ